MDENLPFAIEPVTPRLAVIHVGKQLDVHNAAAFRQACREKVAAGTRHFVLDFSQTDLLDSTGLGAVFSLAKAVTPLHGAVVFASLSHAVALVVHLLRLHRLFPRFPSVRAALGGLLIDEAC